MAGPSPSSPSTPVTSTKVIDETAATSCSTAEFTAIAAARSAVFLRMGRPALATRQFKQPGPERLGAPPRRMAQVGRRQHRRRETPDRNDPSTVRERVEEGERGLDLETRRTPVRS